MAAQLEQIRVGPHEGGDAFLDIVVKLVTDTGVVGYGEVRRGVYSGVAERHSETAKVRTKYGEVRGGARDSNPEGDKWYVRCLRARRKKTY